MPATTTMYWDIKINKTFFINLMFIGHVLCARHCSLDSRDSLVNKTDKGPLFLFLHSCEGNQTRNSQSSK